MVDRVEVQFGGDTTELDAATARANAALNKLQETVNAQTGGTKSLDSATQSLINKYVVGASQLQKGENAFQGISDAVASGAISADLGAKAYEGLALDIEQITEKTVGFGKGSLEALQDVRALGDEVSSGRYRQASGTFAQLFGRFAEASPMIAGATAAIIAAGAGIGYLVYQAIEGTKRLEAFQSAMALLGRSGDATEERYKELISTVLQYGNVSKTEAEGVAQSLAMISSLTEAQKTRLASLIPLYVAQGGKVEEVLKAVSGGSSAMEKFAERVLNMTEAQRQHFEVAKQNNDTIDATDALLDTLAGRLAGAKSEWDKYKVAVKEAYEAAFLPGNLAPENVPLPPKPTTQIDDSGASAEDSQESARIVELTAKYTTHARAVADTEQAIRELTAASKESNITDEERKTRLVAVQEAQNQLDALMAKTTTSEKESARNAKEAAAERLAALRATVEETQRGSAERVEAARIEVAEVEKLYGKASKEYIAAQHALTMATKEEARQRARSQVELNEASRQAALGGLAVEEELLGQKKAMGQINSADELQTLRKLELSKYKIELAGLQDRLSLHDLTLVDQAKLNSQIEILEQKHQLKMTKIANKAQLDQKTRWQGYLRPMNTAVSQSIQGMVMGTTSLRSAVGNLGQSVVANFVNMGVQSLSTWIASHLAMESISTATAAVEVGKNAGVAGSGAFAAIAAIPYVGPFLAPAAAAAAYAGAIAFNSAAGGWDQVPSDQLAMIHKNEMILPADLAGGVRDMVSSGKSSGSGGSGGDIHLNVSAMDSKSFADAISQHDGPIHKAVKKAKRNFQGSRFART